MSKSVGAIDQVKMLILTKLHQKHFSLFPDEDQIVSHDTPCLKGAGSRNSAKLGNYKMSVKVRETQK